MTGGRGATGGAVGPSDADAVPSGGSDGDVEADVGSVEFDETIFMSSQELATVVLAEPFAIPGCPAALAQAYFVLYLDESITDELIIDRFGMETLKIFQAKRTQHLENLDRGCGVDMDAPGGEEPEDGPQSLMTQIDEGADGLVMDGNHVEGGLPVATGVSAQSSGYEDNNVVRGVVPSASHSDAWRRMTNVVLEPHLQGMEQNDQVHSQSLAGCLDHVAALAPDDQMDVEHVAAPLAGEPADAEPPGECSMESGGYVASCDAAGTNGQGLRLPHLPGLDGARDDGNVLPLE